MPRKPITDVEAFTALEKGSEAGLSFFFDSYYSPLVFYAQSITNNFCIAQEIASEAFVKLWNGRETIGGSRKVKFLLYRIVCNASINFLNQQKVQKNRATYIKDQSGNLEKDILERLVEVETYNRLHSLLQTLSPRSRQIFSMFYFQNKAIKEIAKELGISVNTVKTQKLRAIQTLKQYQGTLYFFLFYSLFFI